MRFIILFSYVFWITLINQISQAEVLKIFIIPHSHCDPGWLSTFEEYYQRDVKNILNGVTNALYGDPTKRFIWAEISFFSLWYEGLSMDDRIKFKTIVDSGQFEFVGGGWVQNDEANPDYIAIINQITTGHEYLMKNFGVRPRVGWQIDPFGHSAVMPSLFSLMGMEAMVINRIHHQLKTHFKSQSNLEFIWRGSDLGSDTDMLTHVLHTHYSAPKGFDWEEGEGEQIRTDNRGRRAQLLCEVLKRRATRYKSRLLLVPWGDDFKFRNAQGQFGNMDQIIDYMNKNSKSLGCDIRYSTLIEYFTELSKSETEFVTFGGDFFPYADNEDSYWTGYYTTRPTLKSMARSTDAKVRGAEILHALVRSSPWASGAGEESHSRLHQGQELDTILPFSWEEKFNDLNTARKDTALFLHHDAITGTSRDVVVGDYINRLNRASRKMEDLTRQLIELVLTLQPNPSPKLTQDTFTMSYRGSFDSTLYPIVLYNPLGWKRKEIVSLKVASARVIVLNSDNVAVPSQVDRTWEDLEPAPLAALTLHFMAELPALSVVTYFIKLLNDKSAVQQDEAKPATTSVYTAARPAEHMRGGVEDSGVKNGVTYAQIKKGELIYISNDYYRLGFGDEGLLKWVYDQELKEGYTVEQNFLWYQTHRSGAYIMRPEGGAGRITPNQHYNVKVSTGNIVSTVTVRFKDFNVVVQLPTVKEPSLSRWIQFDAIVSATTNTEIIIRFDTNIQAKEHFWSNNGLQFLKRKRQEGLTAGNFYPSISGCRLNDVSNKAKQFTVMTGHSMACGSQAEGSIELLVHRNLNQDDGRGLSQAVPDSGQNKIPLLLTFDGKEKDVSYKQRSLRLNHPIQLYYKVPESSPQEMINNLDVWKEKYYPSFQPLVGPFPNDVHVLSLFARDGVSDDIALRIQSIAENEDHWKANLAEVFTKEFQASELRQTSLTLNQALALGGYPKRLPWKYSALTDKEGEAGVKVLDGEEDQKQNTEEEGVFISQAALDKVRAEQRGVGVVFDDAARRRLLSLPSISTSQSTSSLPIYLEIIPPNSTKYESRKLLEASPENPLLEIGVSALQIRSYFFRLSPPDNPSDHNLILEPLVPTLPPLPPVIPQELQAPIMGPQIIEEETSPPPPPPGAEPPLAVFPPNTQDSEGVNVIENPNRPQGGKFKNNKPKHNPSKSKGIKPPPLSVENQDLILQKKQELEELEKLIEKIQDIWIKDRQTNLEDIIKNSNNDKQAYSIMSNQREKEDEEEEENPLRKITKINNKKHHQSNSHSHTLQNLHVTLLPKVSEYIIIMLLSIGILIFYLFQLQVLPFINYDTITTTNTYQKKSINQERGLRQNENT